MRESDVLGACVVGKAAPRRQANDVTGTEHLPSTFIIPSGPTPVPKLDNPAAMQAAARVMGRSYVKLLRAATRRGRRLSNDEAQDLMLQLIQGSRLQGRGM